MDISDDDIKKVIRLALIEQRVKNILARRLKTSGSDPETSLEKRRNSDGKTD